MENQIDQVIEELSKIDAAAINVISHSESEKESYAAQIKEQMETFDRELEQHTQKELAAFEAELQAQREEALAVFREHITNMIRAMETWYEQNHTAVADQIVQQLTKE